MTSPMQGSTTGPLSASSILQQQGSGDADAPVSGIPGYTDAVYSPYLQPNDPKTPDSANGVQAGERSTEDMATARRERYRNKVYGSNPLEQDNTE